MGARLKLVSSHYDRSIVPELRSDRERRAHRRSRSFGLYVLGLACGYLLGLWVA